MRKKSPEKINNMQRRCRVSVNQRWSRTSDTLREDTLLDVSKLTRLFTTSYFLTMSEQDLSAEKDTKPHI